MSYLDTALLASSPTQFAASLEEAVEALRAFVAEVLALHDDDYALDGRVVSHYARAVLDARDRADRIAVMGEPARYAEVGWDGVAGPAEAYADGATFQEQHRLRVFVYFGVTEGDEAEDAAAFRALLESRSTSAPGLLYALRRQGYLIVGGLSTDGEEIALSDPADVVAAFVDVAGTGEEYRHECTFTVTLA